MSKWKSNIIYLGLLGKKHHRITNMAAVLQANAAKQTTFKKIK